MVKIKKINLFNFAKFHATIGAIIGLILGIIYSFGGLLIDILVTLHIITTNETPGLSYGTILAFGALIGMPIIFAGMWLVMGIAEGILYNLFRKWFDKFGLKKEGV